MLLRIILAIVVIPVAAVAVAMAMPSAGHVHHRPAAMQCAVPHAGQADTGVGSSGSGGAGAGAAKSHPLALTAATSLLHHLVPHLRMFRRSSLFGGRRNG